VHEKSNHRNPRTSFKQLEGESIAEAWERYHLFVVDIPVTEMEDLDFTQGFYYGLSQEAKEQIDNLAGGTFFLLKTQETRALFEKIATSERESDEYDARENSRATMIDPLTHKFWGLAVNQTSASEEHRAKQEFQAQPSDGKKRPMSRISSDAILDKLQNRLSRSALPTVPCILGPFKVHHALCDMGASMNMLAKTVYDCLDANPLVPNSKRLQLVDSNVVQPYGIAENVLIEFEDSSTLADFMVMDMDPRQQTSIILGKPFRKSVRATIDKMRGMIIMKVDEVLPPQEPHMLLPDSSPPIPTLEEGKMRGGNTRAHEESPSTVKQRTQEGCHDTRQGAHCSREFLSEIHLTRQGCHISYDKFSSHTGNLNLQVWRRSCS
jgi:hypothetical protein